MNNSNDDSIQNESMSDELISEAHRDYYILSMPNSIARKFDSFEELAIFVNSLSNYDDAA